MKKELFLLAAISLLTSCVSMTKYRVLQREILELQARPILDLTDTDGDGILDMIDQENNSPAGAPVNTLGITLDTDGDRIPDYKDKEPYSPPGYSVDAMGISNQPKPQTITEADINKIIDSRIGAIKLPPTNSRLPSIKLPVPTASASTTISNKYFRGAKNYGGISSLLSLSLGNSGYSDLRYFQVLDGDKVAGFAMMTAMEEIDEQGKHKRFWSENNGNSIDCQFDLTCLFKKLTLSLSGYYRTMLIVVTDIGAINTSSTEKPSREELAEIYVSGITSFNSLRISEKTTESYECTVFIYEFEKKQTSDNVKLTPPIRIKSEQHLKSANLGDLLIK